MIQSPFRSAIKKNTVCDFLVFPPNILLFYNKVQNGKFVFSCFFLFCTFHCLSNVSTALKIVDKDF